MPRLLKIILLLFLLSKAGFVPAQTIPLLHYSIKDGLPSNTIYSIMRDSKGFLWFATDKGICRFDGVHFKNYSTFDGLPDNDIFNIKEDYNGRLWMATYSGDLCYNQDGVFHTSSNTPWLKLPIKSPIFRIFLQPDSSINFILNDTEHFIHVKGKNVKRYRTVGRWSNLGHELPLLLVRTISPSLFQLMYKDQIIDIDTTGHVKGSRGFTKNPSYFYSSTLSISDEKSVYLGRREGIYSIKEELLFPLNKTKINEDLPVSIKVKDKNFFIGLTNGFSINDSISIYLGKHATFIENDLEDNIWVATKGLGLYSFSKHFDHLKQYTGSYDNQVVYAKIIKGTLFYVNNQGMLYRQSNGITKCIYRAAKGKKENEEGYLSHGNFLINDHYDFFQFFYGNSIWVSGINKQQVKVKKDIVAMWEWQNADIIVKEVLWHDKHLYITHNYSVDKVPYEYFLNKNISGNKKLIDSSHKKKERILAKAIDKKGNFWFSTSLGLSKIQDDTLIDLPDFKNVAFRQFGLYGNYLVGITQKNKLLVCHNYNGKPTVDSLQIDNCIWENIYPIDENHAIISTNNFNRLLTLHTGTQKVPNYDVHAIEDPFIPVQTELIVADTQHCYFFKEGTVTQIATKVLFEKTRAPVPVFQDLRTSGKTYPLNSRQNITISYKEAKSMAISFDNIAYAGKELNCQYSISDDDVDNWNPISGNEINLNAPGFGTYYIKIRTATLSSGFSDPTVITLTILSPFWVSWWFIVSCVLVILAIIWLAIYLLSRRKIRKQQKEHESDMKYQQSEYKALNALMNPHFIFNSLNNIQGLINKNDKLVANQYLVIFSDLIRQNMHNISKGFITLQEELTLVENYLNLEKLRFKEFISHSITVARDVETDLILIPPLMIQPLVENAVKHGLLPKQSIDNRVSIKVFESLNRLYIEIEDNGVGLTYASKYKSNHLHDSFGLSNLQKRIDYLKKIQEQEINVQVVEILDNSGKALGTRATVTMELGQKGQGL